MATTKKPGTPAAETARKSTKASAVADKLGGGRAAAAKKTVPKIPVKAAGTEKAPAAKPKFASAPARARTSRTAASPASKKPPVSPEQRTHYVQVAAFYIAERRGFAAGNPVEDWLAAEAEVDRLIASGRLGR